MLTIRELVTLDEQAEFRNDVQLDAFDDAARNLSLLRSYLFTGSAPTDTVAAVRSISSVGLLDQIRQAFLSDRIESRIAVIANYGHGKSHLALALANYFGKPTAAEEVQLLFNKIDNAVNDPAKASGFHEFKRSRGEFLVVRLRGDMPRSLREQFMSSLERALGEHQATVGQRPQFWYGLAEAFLRQLSPDDRVRADAFLEQYSTDVTLLLQQVQQHRDVYDDCVRLFTHLYHVPPNFGGEVSLKEVIKWAADSFCGPEKPLGGILILFDEFSAYIQRYAQRNAAGELQDLLNGVDDRRGRVVFLAFAQHDPLTIADQVHLPGQSRESLKRELTRLPKKFALFSLMESVIDAYLKQSPVAWQAFFKLPKVQGHLYQATDTAYEQFKARYDRELHWTIEKFQESVTKGCFPLHPLTTAMLCNLKFSTADEIGTPRTVLGFVMEQLSAQQDLPAAEVGGINWVLPVKLVDYFAARLHDDHYAAFENALRLLDPAAPPDHELILKALLLQEIAGIKARGERQIELLAQCAGLDEEATKQSLKLLSQSRCIRYDPVNKVSSFWALTTSPDELERILTRKLENMPFDGEVLQKLDGFLKSQMTGDFGTIGVSVNWGDSGDWAAHETIVTVEHLTADYLKNLAQQYGASMRGLVEGKRGCVVWLLARNESEIAWYRDQLTGVIDAALTGDAPLPVVCMVPSEPYPEMIDAFQRLRGLEKFDQSDREAAGIDLYPIEVAQTKAAVVKALGRLRGEANTFLDVPRPTGAYGVPLAYRARLIGRPSILSVLNECYKLAYRYAPPEFFTQYKMNRANLRDATKLVASLLLQSSAKSLGDGLSTNPVAKDIRDKFLVQKWGVLSSGYRTQQSNSQAIRRTWEHLDTVCPPGAKETPVDELLIPLLNPPYGYDYNTAVLVFCAWFGFNNHDLQVSARGRVISRELLASWLSKGPKEFLNEVCCTQMVALVRRDPGEMVQEVRTILEKIKVGTFTQAEAEQAVVKLEEAGRDERNGVELRDKSQAGAAMLKEALTEARTYDQQANKLAELVTKERNLASLAKVQKQVANLPRTSCVLTNAPTPAELRAQALSQLEEAVNLDCQRLEDLQRIAQLENNQSQLQARRRILQDEGYAPLVERIDLALRRIDEKRAAIEKLEREEAIRVEIRAMDENARLQTLYAHRARLEEMTGYSPKTMEQRDTRLQRIRQEIERLEIQAESWQSKLNEAVSLKALDGLRDDLLRLADRYQETVFAAKLEAARARAEELRAFYREVEGIRTAAQRGTLSTPAETVRHLQNLDQLADKFAGTIGAQQQALVEETRQAIEKRMQENNQKAVAWLREREAEYRAGQSPVQLKQKLAQPPAFLPEEAQSDLQELSNQVQERIDQDTIARIEQQFRQIADRTQREECLRRLALVMQEP